MVEVLRQSLENHNSRFPKFSFCACHKSIIVVNCGGNVENDYIIASLR